MKTVLTILLILMLIPAVAQEETSERSVFGTRSILKVKRESCRWLRTGAFMGMDIYGDTLYISVSVDPAKDKGDREAGEIIKMRKKFPETRMARVVDFYDKDSSRVEFFTGDINEGPHNGGLVLTDSGMGLMPIYSLSQRKSSLYNVLVDGLDVSILSEWKGNGLNGYNASPTFSRKYRETVFMTMERSFDLSFWDSELQTVKPFAHNTDADEIYPTIYNDSILFFSSDRLKKGVFDIYFYNMNTDEPPQLFMPDVIKTNKSEVGIAFLNDSTCFVASQKKNNDVVFDKIMFEMEPLPTVNVVAEDLDYGLPIDRLTKLRREQGRIALAMFQEKYGVSIPVKRHENIFKDSTDIDPEIVKAVRKVLDKDNVVDISFLLPVEISDTAYLTENYSADMFMMEGLRKAAELLNKIEGSNVMAMGFASEKGGSDLNLMRSYYQASSFKIQFVELNSIPESRVHILNSGDYVQNQVSIRRVTEKEKRGALYLFKNIKAPSAVAAYQLKVGETKEMIAERIGMTSFEFTYYNVLLTPFVRPPVNVVYIPIQDLVMIWAGHDLRETAKKYQVPIKELLKLNNMSDYINIEKRVIYVP